jgi:hypothetical protein
MVVPPALTFTLLLSIPLTVREVAPPSPILRDVGTWDTRVYVYVHVRNRIGTRAGRGAHTGLVARPFRPLRRVPRPRGLPLGRRTGGEIDRTIRTRAQAGVGNRRGRVARHIRCGGQDRPGGSIAVRRSAGFLVRRRRSAQIPIPPFPVPISLAVSRRRRGMVRPVHPAALTDAPIPAPSAAAISRARRGRRVRAR